MRPVRAALKLFLFGFVALVSKTDRDVAYANPSSRVARLRVPPPPGAKHLLTATSFSKLPPISIRNINIRKSASLNLYTSEGLVNEQVAEELDSLLCDARDPDDIRTRTMERRLLQLVFRAAYHFSSPHIDVVSAYREAKAGGYEGVHAQGHAIDFKLQGVTPAALASYLRTIPRVGVGIYTHPKTQFVHLDVREHSFHWLDASPPRRRWRERNISVKGLDLLDSKYTPRDDWPEGFAPPAL